MLSQQELGFNFWGFSFLSRKQGRVLHRFSRIIHEKNFSTKCTYEHDNWPRHTDKSVAFKHWSTLREFQSSLTDFTMPKSSLCCTGLRQYKLKWLLCCYLELRAELHWNFFWSHEKITDYSWGFFTRSQKLLSWAADAELKKEKLILDT